MSGSSRAALLALAGVCAMIAAAAPKKHEAGPFAIVAGTVFRDPGFALPDARVALVLRGDPQARKLQQALTSPRGEFAFRVPPEPAAYVVKASARGYQPGEKEAQISGEERIEVTLTLVPESK